MLLLVECKTSFHCPVVHSEFDKCSKPPIPDYSIESNWSALPNRYDYCDNVPKGINNEILDTSIDVFWVHPTTYTGIPDSFFAWNADIRNNQINERTQKSTMLYQASVFNRCGNIYAPYYRQAHLYAFYTEDKMTKWKALNFAYTDVKSAFEYYLKNYNHGKPIIIASHSQGTIHAYWLLRDYFAGKPLMNQLVAAYLVGMPIPKDSLNFLLPCNTPSQTNCYVAWNTFVNRYEPKDSRDYEISLCTNPLAWTNRDTMVSSKYNQGAVLYNFNKIVKHRVDAFNHHGLLWIHRPKVLLSLAYRPNKYHTGDYNLFYMNVRKNAAERVESYWKQHSSLK